MKNMIKKFIILSLLIATIISCKDDTDGIPDGQGEVKVKLTDGPFPFNFVSEANIGVAKIELKTTDGIYVTVFQGSADYNMVGLTNGATAEVEVANIESGTYVEARVTLDAASVHLSNGNEFSMNAEASANAYTVAIDPALVVEEGETSEILFDLDINDSFQFNSVFGGVPFSDWVPSIDFIGSCGFDADFRVCDLDQTGGITGSITEDGVAVENAEVFISIDGENIYTHTEADGSFAFIGVENGTYTVYATTSTGDSTQVAEIVVSNAGTASCSLTFD